MYLTFDGVLEPVGSSQVLRPVMELASAGLQYTLVSLEKADDLADRGRLERVRGALAELGVVWVTGHYRTGGAGAMASNVSRLFRMAAPYARRADLLHARAHLGATVALGLRAAVGVPYLFDVRGLWVDDLHEQRRWITDARTLRAAKAVERRLICGAAGIVCLTQLLCDDIRAGAFGPFPESRPVRCIPTVADFDDFRRDGPTDRVPVEIRRRLDGKTVIAHIGALNSSYNTDAGLALTKYAMDMHPEVHLLCLTRQQAEMHAACSRSGIPASRVTITSAGHEDMSQWLRLVDWCLLILNSPYAKRGSMPTKLAELFAAHVRPIQFGCNEEVSYWVKTAGGGIVLPSLRNNDLLQGAKQLVETRDADALEHARNSTITHFGLRSATEKYIDVIQRALLNSDAPF